MQNKQIFKSIEEALPVLRPGDKLVKKLSNKYAHVKPLNTDGSFSGQMIMGLRNGMIYSYPSNYDDIKRHLEAIPNIERQMICYDHSENGKPYHYLVKSIDYRRYKGELRKILTLI